VLFLAITGKNMAQQEAVIDSLQKTLLHAAPDTNKVNLLNKLGWEYRNSDLKKVLEYSEKALTLSESLGYLKGKTNSYNNIGNIHFLKGDYLQALEFYLKSLKTVEMLNDKKGIANCLMGVGNVYSSLKNYPLAIEYLEQSLQMRQELDDKDGIAGCYNNLGGIYLAMGDTEKSLKVQMKALAIKKEINDQKGFSSTLGNIGDVYFEMGEFDTALDYQLQALELRKQFNNKKGQAISYGTIGKIYYKKGNRPEAIRFLKESIKYAGEVGYKVAEKDAYYFLSQIFEQENKPIESLKFFKLYSAIKDSLFNSESTEQIASMQAKFDYHKQEKEIELLRKENQISDLNFQQQQAELNKQKMFTYSMIAGFVVLLLLGYLLYAQYKIKNRANKLLSSQNQEIQLQKELIANKNKDITDSIIYAQRIQNAILPLKQEIKKHFKDAFVYFKPKDIVSGDFYWYTQKDDHVILAVADCTGHGVPGALMSMIGNDKLNQIVIEKNITDPGKILQMLNVRIKEALKQNDSTAETRDGMDVAIFSFVPSQKKMFYSGAYRQLFGIKHNGEILEIKADKSSIGGLTAADAKFTSHELAYQEGDKFYLFTDGFPDQFGGENGKKFMSKKFKDFLVSICNNPMETQHDLIQHQFHNWKGPLDQVDDICIVGVAV
jgi:serine phosphatase RsbU (regulator of sigma subunit)